jgi:hypothetical protein
MTKSGGAAQVVGVTVHVASIQLVRGVSAERGSVYLRL